MVTLVKKKYAVTQIKNKITSFKVTHNTFRGLLLSKKCFWTKIKVCYMNGENVKNFVWWLRFEVLDCNNLENSKVACLVHKRDLN